MIWSVALQAGIGKVDSERKKTSLGYLGGNEEKLSVGLSREKDNMDCQLNTFLQERGF